MRRVRKDDPPKQSKKGLPRAETLFKKGQAPGPGRKPGQPNKITTQLKEAILEAAAMVGSDRHGTDGVEGYLSRIAINEPVAFCRLLEKIIPLTLKMSDNGGARRVYESLQDVAEALRERGLPPPANMIDITPHKLRAPEPIERTGDDDDYDGNH